MKKNTSLIGTLPTLGRLAPVSNVIFFSKTYNLSKIEIYKLYLEVEVLGLDIRDWWVRVFINQLTGLCWQGIYHFYYPDLFQAVSVLWNINMCYLIPPAEIYDYTNLQASVSFFSTCLGNFHAFCVCWFSQNIPFLKTYFKNKMKQFGSWSGSMICRAWSGFKLFSKVSADGSDRQISHKIYKFKNAAVWHNILCKYYFINCVWQDKHPYLLSW